MLRYCRVDFFHLVVIFTLKLCSGISIFNIYRISLINTAFAINTSVRYYLNTNDINIIVIIH